MDIMNNAILVTKYAKYNRIAELFELADKSGYIVRLIDDKVIKEDRVIQGKSIYYVLDTCENWVEGIVDPWI